MDDLEEKTTIFGNIHLHFRVCVFFWLQAKNSWLSVFGAQESATNGPSFHRIVRGIEAPAGGSPTSPMKRGA